MALQNILERPPARLPVALGRISTARVLLKPGHCHPAAARKQHRSKLLAARPKSAERSQRNEAGGQRALEILVAGARGALDNRHIDRRRASDSADADRSRAGFRHTRPQRTADHSSRSTRARHAAQLLGYVVSALPGGASGPHSA